MQPQVTLSGDNFVLNWKVIRGMKHKVQTSPDLVTGSDATTFTQSLVNGAIPGDTSGTWTDTNPGAGPKFHRTVRTPAPE